MEVLIRIANRLNGTAPDIDDNNTKKIIFESFRDDWQTDCLKSGNVVADQTLTQIISYMSLCKSVADSKLDNKKRNAPNQLWGAGDNSGNGNKKKKQTCPIHTRSNHTWDECSLNPRSENYGQDMRRNKNNGGQGGRNNYGGRNTYGGRGRGNGNNYRGSGNYAGGRGRGNYSTSSNYQTNNFNNSGGNPNHNGRGHNNQNGSSQNGNYFNQHNPRDQGDHYHNKSGTPDGGWNTNNNNHADQYMNHFRPSDVLSYHDNNRPDRWY